MAVLQQTQVKVMLWGSINPSDLFAALSDLGLTIGDLQSGNYTSEQLIELFESWCLTGNHRWL